MTERCSYGTIKELLTKARDISRGAISSFYEEVRLPLERPNSHLAIRLFSSSPPIYLLQEGERYFRLGRVREIIERFPRLGRFGTVDEQKLIRLDSLPITYEQAIERAMSYDTKPKEQETRAA